MDAFPEPRPCLALEPMEATNFKRINTSSEDGIRNPNATTIIYSTGSKSGETASFGFLKIKHYNGLLKCTPKALIVTL